MGEDEEPEDRSLATVDDSDGWLHEPFCEACNAENDPHNAHCEHCGAALVPTKPLETVEVLFESVDGYIHVAICPSCGSDTDPMFPTCGECGERLPRRGSRILGKFVPLKAHKCPRCGNLIDPQTSCCRACGKFHYGSDMNPVGFDYKGQRLSAYQLKKRKALPGYGEQRP